MISPSLWIDIYHQSIKIIYNHEFSPLRVTHMGGVAGVTGGQGIGSTSVPQRRTQVVPDSGFCLLPIYLVSGFPPTASEANCSRKKDCTSSHCPWVPNSRYGQGGLLEMPSRALQGQNFS